MLSNPGQKGIGLESCILAANNYLQFAAPEQRCNLLRGIQKTAKPACQEFK
jgi:hypothetical protein